MSKYDKVILAKLKDIEARKAQIEQDRKILNSGITLVTGTFGGKHIDTIRTAEAALNFLAPLLISLDCTARASRLLGLPEQGEQRIYPDVGSKGFLLEDVVNTLKFKIAQANLKDREVTLKALETEIADLLSQEAKTGMKIESLLKKLDGI